MNSQQIIKHLEASGWKLCGSHYTSTHSSKPGFIRVPHFKELGVGFTHKLLKQACRLECKRTVL